MHGPTCIVWANLTPFSAMKAGGVGEVFPGLSDIKSHSDTTLYISFVILYTEYTGWCQNDFTAHG
jgi:hypothetical protein